MSGTRSNEDDILSKIPGIEEEPSEGTTSSDESTDQGSQDTDSSAARGTRQTDQGSQEDGNRERVVPEPPVIRRRDGLVERQSQTDPRHRDLVDPVTGQVVARGGIERRIYENAQRATRELEQTRRELQQTKAQLQGHSEAGGIGQQLGLNAEQQTVAMRVMADFIRDPVRTVEYMIQEVRSKGHHIPSLEQGGGSQLDLGAVQRLLDERLRPITSRYEQEQQRYQQEQQHRQEIENFLADEPDARANLDVMAEMIRNDPRLTLQTAYIRMIKWAADNGVDYTQPLGPQIASRQNTQTGTQPRQQRPLPNGRPTMNGAAPLEARRGFDENTEWSDIIQSSMREAGFNR